MMNPTLHAFMNEVLGEDATAALSKAGERSESLAAIVGPRTVVGWVNLAARWDYDGIIPGHDESLLRFAKNEHGLTGTVALGERQLDFEHAQPEHLAAMLCVGLGCPPDLAKSEGATQVALAQLGETIDLMVKARVATLLKAEKPRFDCTCESSHCETSGCECSCHHRVKKAELPGKAAGAIAPDAPEGQAAPQAKAPRRMATAKPTSVAMTKSMVESRCSVCEATQFAKNGDFRGCFCLRELGRFVKSEPYGDGCVVTFGSEWSKKNIALLLDIVGAHHEDV